MGPSDIVTNITTKGRSLGSIKKWGYIAATGAVAVGLLLDSFYTVAPQEEGVVTRFGQYSYSEGPGFHLKAPLIDRVYTPKVKEVKRLEVGFRTINQGPPAQYEDLQEESLMLTGDTNIVDLSIIVQYRISDSRAYLFNVKDVEGTLRDASEASLRQVIGDGGIDEALTTGKAQIQDETASKLQSIVDDYKMGIRVTAVKLQDVDPHPSAEEAFKAVASAKERKDTLINQAEGYRNKVIPDARGEAAKLTQNAEAYKAERVNNAKGDVARFDQILTEYANAPEITRDRLYLEAMRDIFPNLNVTIVDSNIGGPLTGGPLPLMKIPLGEKTGGQ